VTFTLSLHIEDSLEISLVQFLLLSFLNELLFVSRGFV